ncbi:MAG: glycosyltransferase family A protein, partial [Nitrososphaeria archaeon]
MLAVVILTKNSERTIEACLNGLVKSNYLPDQVIIVDGCSKDKTLEIIKDFKSKLNIKIVNDEGKGLGYARDLGFRSAGKEIKYIAMVDSDVVVNENFFDNAIKILETDEKAGAIGAKLIPECSEK